MHIMDRLASIEASEAVLPVCPSHAPDPALVSKRL